MSSMSILLYFPSHKTNVYDHVSNTCIYKNIIYELGDALDPKFLTPGPYTQTSPPKLKPKLATCQC